MNSKFQIQETWKVQVKSNPTSAFHTEMKEYQRKNKLKTFSEKITYNESLG